MSLVSQIESILFVSHSPVSIEQLKKITKQKKKELETALASLQKKYDQDSGGIALVVSGAKYQLVSSPENATLIQHYLKSDITGELTGPALETLTIIAYRGPVTKPEIEHIRGVNCSLILRNLLIRGLVEKDEGSTKDMPRYSVTVDFIRFLGISKIQELPEYETLSTHETLEQALEATIPEAEKEEA